MTFETIFFPGWEGLHLGRLTAGTYIIMEVWFRSCSFLFMGDGCRFQPLIFQGVVSGSYGSFREVFFYQS